MSARFQPRELPAETVDGLRPPRANFPYFAHADAFPFQSHAGDYSPVNAWWLADACLLVYGSAKFVEDAIQLSPIVDQGYELSWLGTADDNRGMVLTSSQAIIVVFRGTRVQKHTLLDKAELVLINQNDLWTDGQFFPAVSKAGGRVHSGFSKAYAEVNAQLDSLVRNKHPDQAVWLTGHSLGGALAVLAAAHLGGEAIHGLYSYGCPRVGDASFAKAFTSARCCRFVHRSDFIPTIPPEVLGYRHVGELHDVPGSPARSFWEDVGAGATGLKSALLAMAKELRVNVGDLPLKVAGIADHSPIYYATLLWNALLAGRAPDE